VTVTLSQRLADLSVRAKKAEDAKLAVLDAVIADREAAEAQR